MSGMRLEHTFSDDEIDRPASLKWESKSGHGLDF